MNGKKPMTLDYKTFVESTRLDYAKGTYVSHPSPEAVKAELAKIVENPILLDMTLVLKTKFPLAWRILFTFVVQVLSRNYSSTEQVNSIQQLFAYCLLTWTKVDIGEIIYSDLVTRLTNKSRQRYVSYPRFISCALAVLLGPNYTQDESFGSSPTILSNSNFSKDPSKVTSIELTDFMVAVNKREHSVNLLLFYVKKKKGKPQIEDQGNATPKPTEDSEQSHSISSGTVPDPQDPERNIQFDGGNIQPADKGLSSIASNEGTTKITPRPERLLGDKDSEGNKPPADMKPINPTIADPSGTGAEYQVDETQSTRLMY
ncbi:hypothetical protein Tco_1239137 [Tanacetum coccineum]